jgi:hypothetical protein
MTTTRSLTAAALLALLASAPAAAQEEAPEPVLPAPGTMSLTLRHDAGSSLIALGRRVGDRSRVELGIGFSANRARADGGGAGERTDEDGLAELRLAVRRYMDPESRVVPFLLAAVSGLHHWSTLDAEGPAGSYSENQRGTGLSIEAGGGVEWFPAARVGISGEAGVGARALRARSRFPSHPDPRERSYVGFRTFTSALSLTLYF